MISDSNDAPRPVCSTLVELLRGRAHSTPHQLAYRFLPDGDAEPVFLTYGELDRRARAIATGLQRSHPVGERVLLLFPPGPDYITAFFGCLYAGVVAVPVYPPRPNQSLARVLEIAGDARAGGVLTTAHVFHQTRRLLAPPEREAADRRASPPLDAPAAESLGRLRWLTADDLAPGLEECWEDPGATPDTLAFLQYTSGSTSAPRGVLLAHAHLLRNLALIHRAFELTPESRGVIWLPPYHDMGLIGGVLQPLYGGFPVTLMSPVAFLQRPFRWLQAIARSGRAAVSGGPDFAYDLCVRRTTPEQRASLDLSGWQLAFTGAEPVRAETLERFAAAFAPCGFRREAFYPCYGLAEATLMATGGVKAEPPVLCAIDGAELERGRVRPAGAAPGLGSRIVVGCGRALPDHRVLIADPETRVECAPDQVGEIWIAGPSVAQGYWNRPEETRQTFQAFLADTGEGPFLRTGDLGFLREGELFVVGRLKDLIIIDGRNHYPQDIERTVERCHPAMRPGGCAAFSVELPGGERLVVVAEVERRHREAVAGVGGPRPAAGAPAGASAEPAMPPAGDGVVGVIRRAIAEEHDLRVHAVVLAKPGSVPKTSSGKIRRHACRAAFLAGTLETVGA